VISCPSRWVLVALHLSFPGVFVHEIALSPILEVREHFSDLKDAGEKEI
jgi:hypothetical protein